MNLSFVRFGPRVRRLDIVKTHSLLQRSGKRDANGMRLDLV